LLVVLDVLGKNRENQVLPSSYFIVITYHCGMLCDYHDTKVSRNTYIKYHSWFLHHYTVVCFRWL